MHDTMRVTHLGFPGQDILIRTEDFDPAVHNVASTGTEDPAATRRGALEGMSAADVKALAAALPESVEAKTKAEAIAAVLAHEFPGD